MEELSVMGLAEIVTKIPHLLARIRQTSEEVAKLRPAALITIDAPDFSFRVAERVKARCPGIPRIHYVAPTVWAWRPGRAAKITRFLDHLLALLPFEPPYFEAEGLSCDFVGHPAIEGRAGQGDGSAFRLRRGLPADRRIVIMLPGSRRGELKRILPLFIETLRRVTGSAGYQGDSALSIVAPVPANLAETVRAATTQSGLDVMVVEDEAEKFDAFAAASAALAKSGTVTLELALSRVPQIIAYRVNPLTYAIARRIATGKYAGLPNIILDRTAAPEFLQDDATPETLARELETLLSNGEARRLQIDGAVEIRRLLSVPGTTPSEAAADAVLRAAGLASVSG
jgi:lipid-A-disaccharide synthase